ncbi:hypothetical protein ACJX0J_014357, partial [Zea mays]
DVLDNFLNKVQSSKLVTQIDRKIETFCENGLNYIFINIFSCIYNYSTLGPQNNCMLNNVLTFAIYFG